MKNNLNLNEEELNAFADAAVHYNIDQQLRSRYDKILAENKFTNRHKRTSLPWISLAKVAAIAVLVLGSIFLIQTNSFVPSAHTTAQNLLSKTNISGNPNITRKGASSASQIQREANDAFTLEDYPLAISKYELLQQQNQFSSLDQFYLGICQLKTDNYPKAIALLSDIKDGNKIQTEEVDWLLSLAFVLSNQEKNAIPLLQKIIANKHYKAAEAEKLLKILE